MTESNRPAGEIILYQTEDGQTKLQVHLEDETVWLTQQQLATLLQTTKQNISLHIHNIYEEGELTPETTVKKILTVRPEGTRHNNASMHRHRWKDIFKRRSTKQSGSKNRKSSNKKGIKDNTPMLISALKAEIDQLVYQLYGLTAEEIAIVEGRAG